MGNIGALQRMLVAEEAEVEAQKRAQRIADPSVDPRERVAPLYKAGRFADAVPVWRDAVKNARGTDAQRAARVGLAEALLLSGSNSAAVPVCRSLLDEEGLPRLDRRTVKGMLAIALLNAEEEGAADEGLALARSIQEHADALNSNLVTDLVIALVEADRAVEAVDFATSVLGRPGLPAAHRRPVTEALARALMAAGRADESLPHWERLARDKHLWPDERRAVERLHARALVLAGRSDDATDLWDQLRADAKSDAERIDTELFSALALLDGDEPRAAIAPLEMLVEAHDVPREARIEARLLLAEALSASERGEEALDTLESFGETTGDVELDGRVRELRLDALQTGVGHPSAVKVAAAIVGDRRAPVDDRWRARHSEAFARDARGEHEVAAELWRDLLEDQEDGGGDALYATRGLALNRLDVGAFVEAEPLLRAMLDTPGQTDREYRGAANLLVRALAELGRFDEALELQQVVIAKGIGESDERWMDHRNLAFLLWRTGDSDHADALLQELLADRTQSPDDLANARSLLAAIEDDRTASI